ncbi:type II secretion system protein GspG [Candidatus Dependentiae bacterium]|nr:type II secretion system protein GspG [Candidatus Dependentiae bacterium]
MLKQNKTLQPGFNFIELLISITIIALFIGFVGPKFMRLLGKGQKTATESTLKGIAAAIAEYKMDIGRYPNNLEELIKKPENATNWQGPYLSKNESDVGSIPQDPWGQPIQYKLNDRGVNPPFDLYSLGDPEKEDARISYAK